MISYQMLGLYVHFVLWCGKALLNYSIDVTVFPNLSDKHLRVKFYYIQ